MVLSLVRFDVEILDWRLVLIETCCSQLAWLRFCSGFVPVDAGHAGRAQRGYGHSISVVILNACSVAMVPQKVQLPTL